MRNSKFLFYLVFFSILLFFVIPPIGALFFMERQEAFVAHYPVSVFLNGIIVFLIYYFSQVKPKIFDTPPLQRERLQFFVYSSNALVCFGILCLSSVGFEAISFSSGSASGILSVIFPDSFLGWTNFFFGVIFAAFCEEVIYRFFLPSALSGIFCKRENVNKRKSLFFGESISVILFALGHLYLGIFGFLNALVCGIALRVCMVRTKSLWIPFAIHSIYNFLSFLMIRIMC